MYELFVLACLISNPTKCVTLEDLYVISSEIPEYLPQYYAKAYKCLDMSKEGSKINT